jgi:hypothetical protein
MESMSTAPAWMKPFALVLSGVLLGVPIGGLLVWRWQSHSQQRALSYTEEVEEMFARYQPQLAEWDELQQTGKHGEAARLQNRIHKERRRELNEIRFRHGKEPIGPD